jgi:anti-anti-sigma factor
VGWRPGWDGHLLLFYDDEAQRRDGVAAWVRRGLELGSKILYTVPQDDHPADPAAGLLGDEPGALEAMHRDQIQMVPADRTTYDPDFMEALVDGALAEGYPSVRWSANVATAWGVMPRSRHERLEQAVDRLCTSRPLSVLCQYPTPESRDAVGALSRSHRAGLRQQLMQAAPVDGGLAVAGELDITNERTLRSLLAAETAAAEHGLFVLDLSLVDFLDLPGARALLFGTLDYRCGGGRVRLQAPQPHVAHLIHLLGIDREDAVEVVDHLGGEAP